MQQVGALPTQRASQSQLSQTPVLGSAMKQLGQIFGSGMAAPVRPDLTTRRGGAAGVAGERAEVVLVAVDRLVEAAVLRAFGGAGVSFSSTTTSNPSALSRRTASSSPPSENSSAGTATPVDAEVGEAQQGSGVVLLTPVPQRRVVRAAEPVAGQELLRAQLVALGHCIADVLGGYLAPVGHTSDETP